MIEESEDWRLEYIQSTASFCCFDTQSESSCRSNKSSPQVHPLARVGGKIGEGTRIWAWAHVMEGAEVGKNCNIGEHVFVESGAIIGDNCIIKNGVCIWEGILIENNVFVAAGAVFTNEKYTRSGYRREHLTTHVEKGATIGAGAVILPGLRIGKYATIGAGAVITKSVMPHALVYGNPAEQHGWVCECGVKLVKDHYDFYPKFTSQVCSDCGAIVEKALKERWHSCECGCSLHRDMNGSYQHSDQSQY